MILKASLGGPHCSHAVAGGKEHNSLQCPAGGKWGGRNSPLLLPQLCQPPKVSLAGHQCLPLEQLLPLEGKSWQQLAPSPVCLLIN